jgi:hypothetical protein
METIPTGGFVTARQVVLCVSSTSPDGNYTFVNTTLNRNTTLDGMGPSALPGNGFHSVGPFPPVGDYDGADGGNGTTSAPGGLNTPYTVHTNLAGDPHTGVTNCVTILNRTVGDAAFMAKLPIADGGTCTQACGGINDTFAGITFMYNGTNNVVGGATYVKTDCLLDNGVLIPEQTNPPLSFFNAAYPHGSVPPAYNSATPAPYNCDTNNNPTRAFANFEHGAVITFFFTAPTGHNCTFTQGYYKNHESYTAGVLSGNAGTTYIDALGKLIIGSYHLSAAQVDDILGAAVGHGYNAGGVTFTKDQLSMIHQLITAELNIAGGAAPASIVATITDANNYVGASKTQLSSWTNTLDNFNQGKNGPGHCS